jgi:YesN/AraC family two-component response regulator
MNSSASRRLLVVEDEALVAESLSLVLRRLGYEVAAIVDNGEDAIKMTFALIPDLVLMDIGLRGPMDGAEAARQIRLTLKKARECEPYGFILKPFGERELFVQIDLALHRHKVETERSLARRELEIAHGNLRNLRGLLPVCAGCKKIQEADGRWQGLEDFFKEHANVELTHGFCPDCENRLYGTHSRPPFPLVLPVLNSGDSLQGEAAGETKEKPAANKPRAEKNEKSS